MTAAITSSIAQDIVETLENSEFYRDEVDAPYAKELRNGDLLEVIVDERANEAVVIRYNYSGSQQSYKAISLSNRPAVNLLLTELRNAF